MRDLKGTRFLSPAYRVVLWTGDVSGKNNVSNLLECIRAPEVPSINLLKSGPRWCPKI